MQKREERGKEREKRGKKDPATFCFHFGNFGDDLSGPVSKSGKIYIYNKEESPNVSTRGLTDKVLVFWKVVA